MNRQTEETARGGALYFEDFVVGWVVDTEEVAVTEAMIREFGRLYDPQPYHTDPEAAKETLHGTLIASGWQTAALCFRQFVLTGAFEACGIAGLGVESLRWLHPVRPDDRLRVRVEVVEQRPSATRDDRGYVKKRFDGYNQRGELVITFFDTSVLKRRPRSSDGSSLPSGR